jgi:PAS domain-containing protein
MFDLEQIKDQQRAEVVAYRKNGTPIWVELTNIALRGASRVTGYVGIHRNITGRKRLQAEQQRLVDIVQNSSDFIGICDLDWQVIFVNGAGQRLVGLNGMEQVRHTRVPVRGRRREKRPVSDRLRFRRGWRAKDNPAEVRVDDQR